ncbi:c-type cytochrome biogenesis protein CcmI [Xanthobacter sp. TB0136]|uniref:c-type cytochrome biogenesis protein CcmI n=1 Tax=Xanthobacter sp. TB0136 TaxID=3459177 RepID=UPI0040399493
MMSAALFIAFIAMTAFAVLLVLWPLSRARTLRSEQDADLAVYRDQLSEIERDRESGRLPAAEAEAARAEVARRLIAAGSEKELAEAGGALVRRRVAAVFALLVVPVVGAGIYGVLGAPDVPGAPLAQRLASPPDRNDIAIMVRKVEEHLKQNPDDAQGYALLAPIYLRLQRPEDAGKAYAQIIRILGPNGDRLSAMGETMVAANDGIVSNEASRIFREAVKMDPQEPRALYFLGVAAEQDGRPADAVEIWRRLERVSPADAPYLPLLRRAMARAQAETGSPATASAPAAPGPTAEDVSNAAQMSAGDRSAMIQGMVSRLEDRLNDEPNDLDGWLRLARAFTVMGENDKAKGALEKARTIFAQNPQALARINDAAQTLAPGE